MTKYSPAYKQRVVREYKKRVRGKGFRALGKRFLIPHSLIRKWWNKWEASGRTVDAFEDLAGGDRRSLLSERERERYIRDFVSHKNALRQAVDYVDVINNLRKRLRRLKNTDEQTLQRIVQRIGKEEMNISWKKTTNTLESDESQERYQARLDIWGAISYNKALAIDIQTSEDRKRKGVKGYGKKDIKLFLRKKVAPQVAKMKENVMDSMDRGFHFTPDEIEEELKKGGAKNIEDVWIFPPNAGKLCDPLDNTLWHSMKDKVRRSEPVDEKSTARAVKKAFMETPVKDLHNYYRNCSLTFAQNPYKDLDV